MFWAVMVMVGLSSGFQPVGVLHTVPQSEVAPLSKGIAADTEGWSPKMASGSLGITKQYVRGARGSVWACLSRG